MSGTAKVRLGRHWSDPSGGSALPIGRILTAGADTLSLCSEERMKLLLPTLPYPQWLAVFPDVAASRGVLIPVQAAVVEIFLLPVKSQRWEQVTLQHKTPCSSQHRASSAPSSTDSWHSRQLLLNPQKEPLHVKQKPAGKPCPPCLPHHPRRNWPQDPLHHGQVLSVVMCLRERNVKGRHERFHSFYLPALSILLFRTPCWATPRLSLQDCSDGGNPNRPRGSWDTISILS